MTDVLPRPTFKTPAHAEVENAVATFVGQWANASYLKIGNDDPEREKSRIDGLFYRDHVVAFAEIKSCSRLFDDEISWTTSERKVLTARSLHQIVRVPVLFVVRFGCGIIAYINSDKHYERVENWGRTDRNSPGDIEPGARFRMTDFRMIGCENLLQG